jgi:hypothetical protein
MVDGGNQKDNTSMRVLITRVSEFPSFDDLAFKTTL